MKADTRTGDIWFTTFSGSTIGVIQKIDDTGEYKITEFSMENNETFPSGIFLQGDYVWITDTLQFDRIIKFKPIVDDNGRIIDIVKVMHKIENRLANLRHSSAHLRHACAHNLQCSIFRCFSHSSAHASQNSVEILQSRFAYSLSRDINWAAVQQTSTVMV